MVCERRSSGARSNTASSQTFVVYLRLIADGELGATEGCRSYHGDRFGLGSGRDPRALAECSLRSRGAP
jgi:hypothetical protein